MRTLQGNTLQSLRAVRAFLDANAAALPTVVGSGARRRLDDLVTALDGHASAQSESALGALSATQKHRALRAALLRDHMAPIAKVAASELPASPELEPLRMPRGAPSAERLKALAAGMAAASEPHAAVFTAAGLPDDFIAQLNAAADAMLATVGERRQSRAQQVRATNGLKSLLSAGRRVVHVIDAMAKSALRDDPVLLAAWNRVKRVELVGGGGQPATSPPSAPPPDPAPAPATAA